MSLPATPLRVSEDWTRAVSELAASSALATVAPRVWTLRSRRRVSGLPATWAVPVTVMPGLLAGLPAGPGLVGLGSETRVAAEASRPEWEPTQKAPPSNTTAATATVPRDMGWVVMAMGRYAAWPGSVGGVVGLCRPGGEWCS